MANEPGPKIIGPVPPQDVAIPLWIKNQFEQIEKLQLLIINQQGNLQTELDTIHTESILLWSKVRELGALCSNEVIPELEKIINIISAQAIKIDEKVPDVPPIPPSSGTTPPSKPPPSGRPTFR